MPITFVRKKRPGSSTARLLCDSAAKLTTTSISSSASTRSASSRSRDVTLDEPHVEPVEVAPVAGVREQVERDHVVRRTALQPVAHEVRADEAGRAGDEEPHTVSLRRENRSLGAPQMLDARIVPRDAVLVRIGRVVLLRDEIGEEGVRQRLVAVGVDAGDVDRDRVLVADVLGERLAGGAVEHDDAHHPLEADEEVVLAALVIVEAADHAAARAREVGLPDRLGQSARARELGEPAALVGVPRELEPPQAVDHPRRPFRTKSLTE